MSAFLVAGSGTLPGTLPGAPPDILPDIRLVTARQRRLALATLLLIALLLLAAARHGLGHGAGDGVLGRSWLLLHLATVLPALPLGAVLMLRRKGGRAHRTLGRVWAVLMLLAAATGLGLGRHWSPIHLLSLLVLVTVPASVLSAIRGDVAAHRRGVTLLFASLLVAGFFTLLPMRLLGGWLFDPAG